VEENIAVFDTFRCCGFFLKFQFFVLRGCWRCRVEKIQSTRSEIPVIQPSWPYYKLSLSSYRNFLAVRLAILLRCMLFCEKLPVLYRLSLEHSTVIVAWIVRNCNKLLLLPLQCEWRDTLPGILQLGISIPLSRAYLREHCAVEKYHNYHEKLRNLLIPRSMKTSYEQKIMNGLTLCVGVTVY